MKHFLTPRPPEVESGLPRADEDADMDIDESHDDPLVSGARPERVVDAREIDALIELFRQYGVKGERAIEQNCERMGECSSGVISNTYPCTALKRPRPRDPR